MKKVISFLLSIVMLIGAVFCVDLSVFANELYITNRAEWLSKLVETFDMTVESDNYPDNYFSDLTEESEYYRDVLVATEFGLVNIEAGDPVNPDGDITREFVAQTLNFCLGFTVNGNGEQEENYEYTFLDYEECLYPDDDQVAVNRGWFSLDENGCFNPNNTVTQLEIENIIDDAESVKNDEVIDNNYNNSYVFADYVIEIPASTVLTINNDYIIEIYDCPKEINVGDTFVVYSDEIPIVRVAEEIQVSDKITTIKTSEADMDTAVISVDMENISTVDISQFEPADGMEIVADYAPSESSSYSLKNRSVITSDNDITLDGDVEVKGVKVGITAKISNISINTKIDTKNDDYFAVVSYDAQITTSVSVNAFNESITLGTVNVFGVGKVTVSLNMDLKGNANISQKFKSAVGFSFSSKDGLRNITSFKKEEFTMFLQVSGSIGLKIGAKISIIVFKAEIFGDIGFRGNVTNTYNSNTIPRMCTSIEAYLYLVLGYSFSVGISFVKINKSNSVNIFTLKNSPVRIYIHLEDGYQVEECKKGIKYNYLTPKNSDYVSINSEYFENLAKEDTFELTYQISEDDLEYSVSNGKASITGFLGYDGEYDYVAIPSEINGNVVTRIEKEAFKNSDFSSIIIPKSVNYIGDYAFLGGNRLKKIVILNDNISIGKQAFNALGDVAVYCNENSSANAYCMENEGFHYETLKWNGSDIWGVASSKGNYHVYTACELAYISQIVANGYSLKDCVVKLEFDLDFDNNLWLPIGNKNNPYCGSFDGNNNTISSIRISSDHSDGGLFGYVESDNSYFCDLNLASGNIRNLSNLGGLIGSLNIVANSNVLISNISSDLDDQSTGSLNRGGIIGLINGGTNSITNIRNCKNYGNIKAYEFSGNVYVGGIVGQSIMEDGSEINFNQCLNTGKLSTSLRGAYSASFAGGLLGKGNNGSYFFQECAVDGEVYSVANGSIASSGGMVSVLEPKSIRIENCEVFAYIHGSQSQNAGFISALNFTNIEANSSYIKNSYISSVIQGGEIGAFIRGTSSLSTYDILIENTYFDSGKTSTNKLVYSTSRNGMFYNTETLPIGSWCNNSGNKDTQTLKSNKELYNSWDFDSVWDYDDSGYPMLKCFENVTPCSEHDYNAIVISPTCTTQGYTTYTCKKCKHTYNDSYSDALGHDYSIYKETVLPTCTAQGYDLYTCSRCTSKEKRNYVDATGHSYQVTSNTATCTEAGIKTSVCSKCGDTTTADASALGHLYSKVYTAPTCTESGGYTNTCTRCNDVTYDIYEALGHDYGQCIGFDYIAKGYGENGKFFESPNGPETNGEYIRVSSCIGSTSMSSAVVTVLPQQIKLDINNPSQVEGYKFWIKKRFSFMAGSTCDGMFAYDSHTNRSPDQSAIPYTDNDGNLVNMKYVDYLTDEGWVNGKYKVYESTITDENGNIVSDSFIKTRPHIVYTKESAEENGILNSDGTVNVNTTLCQEITFSAGAQGIYFIAELYKPSNTTGKYIDTFAYDKTVTPKSGVYNVNVCFYNSRLCGTSEFDIKIYDKSELQKQTNENEYTLTCIECGENHTEICDRSAIVAALNRASECSTDDYSTESLEVLKGLYDKYEYMSDSYASQEQIDYATCEILTAITQLVPYLNLNVSAPNGSFTVTYNDETNSSTDNSLLFGTNVTLTATANEGYEFVGWYDTVNNLYFSKNAEYSFKLITNTSLKAVFVKEQSSTLTFTTYSNWIQSAVTKTIDEWNNITAIDDLLPEVPYKYGYSNGRWVYDNAEVLAKLQTGENVSLIPEYDEDDTSLPTPPSPDGDTPVLDLYYKLDSDANVGSFVMAAGIPQDCKLESVGVAFYYKNADEFDPTKFELLINNKMLVSRFNTDVIDDFYIVNVSKFSSVYNWASRGYVTYYDADGTLKTVYSNQINIVNREQV